MVKTTISVIKADIGGFIGHSSMHPAIKKQARDELERHLGEELEDFHVSNCGDDLELIMTHFRGKDDRKIHKIAWDTFLECTKLAKKMKLYGAGQDILKEGFSGNVKGMGPGVAEVEFKERKSDPVLIFMADKTDPACFNLPLYRVFSDPTCNAGLIIDPKMHEGFDITVHDVINGQEVTFSMPEEMYDALVFLGARARYCVSEIHKKSGEIAAAVSTQKLNLTAGRYVGKDDPVAIVRAQSGFPAVGEVLEAFAFPHLVAGWMRGSHYGPLMPVGLENARLTRFDGPPRIVCLGFQINDGKLGMAADMFKDIAFNPAREKALEIAEYLKCHGSFEPHRLPLDEMEYTTMPQVMEKLKHRFKKIGGAEELEELEFARNTSSKNKALEEEEESE